MLLIPCPWCGERDEVEFRYGGAGARRLPGRPGRSSTTPSGPTTCSCAPTRKGPFRRALVHTRRLPALVQRRARHEHARGRGLVPARRAPGARAGEARAGRRADRSPGAAPLHVRRRRRCRRCAGDTLASALLANGVRVVARSAVPAAARAASSPPGAEEPNALVRRASTAPARGDAARPRTVELFDGLVARSARAARAAVRATAARPARQALRALRRARGRRRPGRAGGRARRRGHRRAGDPRRRRRRARRRPARRRARARRRRARVGDAARPRSRPARGARARRTRPRSGSTTNPCGAARWPSAARRPAPAAQRLWQIRARQVVLATGAHERPIVFAGNDRPGVMLAGAARTYVNR